MINPKTSQWLKEVRAAGFSNDKIKDQLKSSGWSKNQIDEIVGSESHFPAESKDKDKFTMEDINPKKNKIGSNLSKKAKILIIAGALLVIFLGGGVYAYMNGYLPLPFLTNNAESLLKQSFSNLAKSEGGEIGLTFQIISEERSAGLEPFDFSLEDIVGEPSAKKSAKDTTVKYDLLQLKTALVLYADDHNDLYPDTIEMLSKDYMIKIPQHPDGGAYSYTVSVDKKSYELSSKCLNGSIKKMVITSDGTFTDCEESNSSIGLSSISFLDGILQWIPSDLDINGEFITFTTYKNVAPEKRKGIFTMKGSLSTGGTTFSVDGEVRQKGNDIYVQIRQFPSLFFFDVSAIKDNWIYFNPQDQNASLMGFSINDFSEGLTKTLPKKEKTELMKNELSQIINVAFDTGILTANQNGKESIENHPTYRIKIIVNPQKLPNFVEAYRADAKKRNIDITDEDKYGNFNELLTNLIKPEFIKQASVFFKNTSFTVWVDQSGFKPRKIIWDIIVIPPKKLEKLENKQIRLSFGVTFDQLGKEPKVKAPDNIITLDEVERLLSGMTVEEQKMQKQISAITDIRSALNHYKQINKKYPETLEQLLDAQAPITNSALPLENKKSNNYFYMGATSLPNSVYPNTKFEYTSSSDNYTIKYIIINTTNNDTTGDSIFDLNYYDNQMVVDGENTATKDFFSIEAQGSKDSDNDGLTDQEEEKYGTNVYNKDSDNDGYSDKDEIDAGYDPLTKPPSKNILNNTGTTDLTITDEDHIRGNINAPVTIVEYADFECPFCQKFKPTLDQILEDYDGQVRLVYRHFPLSFHPNANKAAEASECANDQGMFWEMHDYMFSNQNMLDISSLKNAAIQLGMNADSFDSCLDTGKYEQEIAKSIAEGKTLGIQGTPSTFINGNVISGAQPYESLSTMIDQALL